MMRTGQAEQARLDYYHALKKDLNGFYQHPNAPYTWYLGETVNPSVDKVALSIIEYYFQNLDWLEWNPLCQVVLSHPAYNTLSLDTRVRLEAVHAYSSLLHSTSLEKYTRQLESLLAAPNLKPVTVIICHYVLMRLYLLQRLEDKVHKHLQQALNLCQANNQTFFQSFILEAMGTVYYYLNQHRRNYYVKAIEKYHEAEVFVRAHNNGLDYTHNPYNSGWVYAELREYDRALSEFQRGFAELKNPDTLYIGAQYRYGIGYVYLSIEQYDEALDYLLKAINFFWDRSYVNTAACLNLVADIYRRNTNITKAIDYLESAASNLQRADHPVQLHHVYRQFSKIYFSQKNFLKAIQYFLRVYRLRFQYKMPLLPY
jgi:tetratricopeptide (TPR) repeat protein